MTEPATAITEKPMKYLALILSTLALVLLVLVTVSVAQRMAVSPRAMLPVQTSLQPLTERQIKGQADLQTALATIQQFNAQRALPLAADSGSTRIRSAGEEAAARGAAAANRGTVFALSPEAAAGVASVVRSPAGTGRSAPAPIALPRVSVVLEQGSAGRKAVVNGNLVGVGDAIAGGMVVKSIDIDRVTFVSGKEELQIKMPLERLRVLGAFPAQPVVQ